VADRRRLRLVHAAQARIRIGCLGWNFLRIFINAGASRGDGFRCVPIAKRNFRLASRPGRPRRWLSEGDFATAGPTAHGMQSRVAGPAAPIPSLDFGSCQNCVFPRPLSASTSSAGVRFRMTSQSNARSAAFMPFIRPCALPRDRRIPWIFSARTFLLEAACPPIPGSAPTATTKFLRPRGDGPRRRPILPDRQRPDQQRSPFAQAPSRAEGFDLRAVGPVIRRQPDCSRAFAWRRPLPSALNQLLFLILRFPASDGNSERVYGSMHKYIAPAWPAPKNKKSNRQKT